MPKITHQYQQDGEQFIEVTFDNGHILFITIDDTTVDLHGTMIMQVTSPELVVNRVTVALPSMPS